MKIEPFASLRAEYGDSSYFDTNLHRGRGEIAVPYEDAHKTILDYVTLVLSKWEKTDTKSPPLAYKVYLNFTANYADGRKAQRTEGQASFATVELAVKHTSERSKALLQELYEIGMDDL